MDNNKLISVIVPCYNESDGLEIFYNELCKVANNINNYRFEFIFIDDGSKDNTIDIICNIASNDERVEYISFSRNFGKESAMLAGLKNSSGDFVVIMDADLQHPPTLLYEMIEGVESGYDSVATKRKNRKGEPKIRSYFANLFYKIVNKTSKIQITEAATDYRLMNRKMVNGVLKISEYHRFTKGIFEWVGFKTKWIEIENVERVAGETTWSFWSLLSYAIEGIVSFSVAPLKIASVLGGIVSSGAFIYTIYIIIRTLILGKDVPGYASLLSIVLFLGGIQLISIGIIGEYLSRTYMETKRRPNYIADLTNIKDVK
ncbi:glycosyltransferase family 2 protein [Clostridium sp. NSJ-145]|uniref:glycosyltransferase family 2 protein n=1 Tax=Clostridium sp. NSJ-145 TaxID=2897777 RepID=UPI001E4CE52E|nr:glycosyltransferase family 2 protein [Clostridium sp. NSJ-145]MCD2502369.1 glycosyltransferase family 2 protein [Clostridium sp. NSJ-145]